MEKRKENLWNSPERKILWCNATNAKTVQFEAMHHPQFFRMYTIQSFVYLTYIPKLTTRFILHQVEQRCFAKNNNRTEKSLHVWYFCFTFNLRWTQILLAASTTVAIEASVVEHLCYLCDSVWINTAYSNAYETSAKRSISVKKFFSQRFCAQIQNKNKFLSIFFRRNGAENLVFSKPF